MDRPRGFRRVLCFDAHLGGTHYFVHIASLLESLYGPVGPSVLQWPSAQAGQLLIAPGLRLGLRDEWFEPGV